VHTIPILFGLTSLIGKNRKKEIFSKKNCKNNFSPDFIIENHNRILALPSFAKFEHRRRFG